ncbi:MAG: DnaJ domain-containing protein [Leptospiraceae bacterium]|nr:DnaJ domain-containing protein [Leptospiraceae bacterium]
MSAIQKYQLYLETLGVAPGDDAQTVKRAFRDRIKKHHPDTARTPADAEQANTLIEAYTAFKKGVPHVSVQHGSQRRPVERPAPPRAHTRQSDFAADVGRQAGQRIYEAVHGGQERFDDAEAEYIQRRSAEFFSRISQLFGAGLEREEQPDFSSIRRPAAAGSRTATAHRSAGFGVVENYGVSSHLLDQAEENLRDIVAYFNQANQPRFTRRWMRSYVEALNQVQVRFRDVSNRHPGCSGRALRRVRQIHELIAEIKQGVR